MRFALVGIGAWGQTYIRNLKEIPGAELVATCSKTNARYDALPPELKIAPHYTSFVQMLVDEVIDTVIIATHPDSHYELSKIALIAGKHVICEKPCMFTPKQFHEISELTYKRPIFYTDYTTTHYKSLNEVGDFINKSKSDLILNIVNIGCGPVRLDYSDIWDYGSHTASILFTLFPNFTLKVVINKSVDEHGNTKLRLKGNEVIVNMTFGNKAPERLYYFHIKNKEASLHVDNSMDNPLKNMLEKFTVGKVATNLELSKKISNLLSRIT